MNKMAFGLHTTLSSFCKNLQNLTIDIEGKQFTKYRVCSPLHQSRSVVSERECSCMPTNTRTSYQRLGLATRNPSEYLPLQRTKPKMSDTSANSVKKMVEEALARQREDMMSKFSEILKTQQVPNSVAPFHGNTPFKYRLTLISQILKEKSMLMLLIIGYPS